MLLKDRKWLNTGGEMSFVNQNQFPCILLFFRWAQGSVIVYWEGGDRSREYLRIIWFFGRAEGGDQKCCIPGCGFWLNAYLRTSFRLCVSGMTPMSRFYYPNVVGKGQQVKMQRRGPVLRPTVILTSNMSKLSLCISGARENLCSVRPKPSRVEGRRFEPCQKHNKYFLLSPFVFLL